MGARLHTTFDYLETYIVRFVSSTSIHSTIDHVAPLSFIVNGRTYVRTYVRTDGRTDISSGFIRSYQERDDLIMEIRILGWRSWHSDQVMAATQSNYNRWWWVTFLWQKHEVMCVVNTIIFLSSGLCRPPDFANHILVSRMMIFNGLFSIIFTDVAILFFYILSH